MLLHEPESIFLDEATSGLDAETEARVYELLAKRLPDSAVVSVAHRPSLIGHHARRCPLVQRPGPWPSRLAASRHPSLEAFRAGA